MRPNIGIPVVRSNLYLSLMNGTVVTETDHPRPQGAEIAMLAIVLAAGAVLRAWNLSWGLPDVFEEATPFMVARTFWGGVGGTIGFRPDFFHYPALSFYLHFLVQGAQYLAGALTGQFPTIDAFRGQLETNPGGFMLAARSLSLLFDIGTVALGWLTARRMFGRAAALGTALLLAFNPILLEGATGVNVDVILTFFLVLALHQSLKLPGSGTARPFILTGIVIGLAASTKYTGALFLVLPALVIAASGLARRDGGPHHGRSTAGRALLVPLSAGLVFMALNPYILIDPQGFLRDFTYEQYHMSYGHLGLDASRTTGDFYLFGTLVPRLGLMFVAGAAAGAVISFARKHVGGISLFITALTYLVVISTWVMRAERYLLPAVPFLTILCAAGCVRAAGGASALLSRFFPGRNPGQKPLFTAMSLTVLAIGAALIVPVGESVAYLVESGRTDTRTVAREWIAENVAPGSVITSGPFGISFPPDRQVLYIPFVATGSEATAPFYDVRWYEDFELLIASDYDYGRYSREPDRFRDLLKFYDDLRSGWKLLAEIPSDSLHRGPTLWFYTPGTTGQAAEFDRSLLSRLSTVSDSALVSRFAQNLSGALYARGRLRKCEQILEAGLRFDPGNLALTRIRAYMLYKEERFTEAGELLTRAVREWGESYDLLSLHGDILLRTGDPDGAEKLLLRARDLRPGSPLPYTLLIGIYSERRDTASLIRTLERYRSIAPSETGESARIGGWIDSLRTGR